MKKVKIVFTAAALLAVVGGALAFKANRSLDKVFVHDINDTRSGACTLQSLAFTTFNNGETPVQLKASGVSTTQGCVVIPIYPAE